MNAALLWAMVVAAVMTACTVNVEVHVDIEGGACLDVPQLGHPQCNVQDAGGE